MQTVYCNLYTVLLPHTPGERVTLERSRTGQGPPSWPPAAPARAVAPKPFLGQLGARGGRTVAPRLVFSVAPPLGAQEPGA